MKLSSLLALAPLALLPLASAQIPMDVENPDVIIAAAKTAAKKLRALYPSKEPWFVPGEFGKIRGAEDDGYYWWEAGAAMGAWVDYWAYTGDSQYNDIVTEGLLHQVGPDNDYQPPTQTLALGNDDQAFWAIAVMAAAERKFPDPPEDKPQWLALAQAVFNRQAGRWDDETCRGGLRWQVFSSNKGYDYKNSVSNGLLMQIGARLGRYTGNTTYIEWAEKVWEWSRENGLVAPDYKVYDGSHIPDKGNQDECPVSSKTMWSYNAGIYLSAAAFLYDYYLVANDAEKAATWQNETTSLLTALEQPFFNLDPKYPLQVMHESACESRGENGAHLCNTDQRSFKAYLARFLSNTYQLVPSTRDWIVPRLKASAISAAKSCNGGEDKITCGLAWKTETYDGSPYGIAMGGVGEHMAVMELFGSLLAPRLPAMVTEKTGTSKGDPTAGTDTSLTAEDLKQTSPTTMGDKAGAGLLTALCLGGLLGMSYWIITD